MGAVPFSVLFAPAFLQLVEVFPCDSHPRRTARLSHHLLLLPQSLLPRLFSRPSRLHRRRARIPQKLSRRNSFSLHPAKRPSLLSLSRHPLYLFSLVRRHKGIRIRRQIRRRPRFDHHARQRLPPHRLHFFLPLLAPHRRRQARLFLLRHFRRAASRRMEFSQPA